MTQILLRAASGEAMFAYDHTSADYLAKLKPGEIVRAEIRRCRNPRQHRLYWALIGAIFPQQSAWATQEQLHNAIKCAVGYCDTFRLTDDRIMTSPKSIAFGNMPQDEWEQFFDKVIALVCERIIPGLQDKDLRQQVEEMIG